MSCYQIIKKHIISKKIVLKRIEKRKISLRNLLVLKELENICILNKKDCLFPSVKLRNSFKFAHVN